MSLGAGQVIKWINNLKIARTDKMNKQLLEIHPKQMKFIFELKKQSSCSVRLTNNTHNYVAFKVKTTSPKKYCVRPNVGIVMPKSTCDFTVIMQAQGVAPPDMVCKDKFLIQSTVVPVGTTDKDITASMFAKDNGRYIEENKLRVTLISPPNSPMLSPINGALKQGPAYEASILKVPVLNRVQILTPPHVVATNMDQSKTVDGEDLKPAKVEEFKLKKDIMDSEELKPAKVAELKPLKDVVNSKELRAAKYAELEPRKDVDNTEELKPAKVAELEPWKDVDNTEELKPAKVAELEPWKDVNNELKSVRDAELKPRKDVPNDEDLKAEKDRELNLTKELADGELRSRKDTELTLRKEVEFKATKVVEDLKLVKDVEEMKSKLNELESKLNKAEVAISKLMEERRLSIQERKILQGELETLRSRTVMKKVQVGFPLLFVCMVAFISFVVGYCILR